MRRIFTLTIALAAIFPLTNVAQTPVQPAAIALKLIPAVEPVPALKYTLLPEMRDQTPGNAALWYYRAFSPEWQGFRRNKDLSESLEKALEYTPLKSLPATEAAKQLDWVRNSPMLGEVDRAARRSHCDWELAERLREDGIGLLLPDLQGMRELGRLLAVRARLDMADGKFDAAAKTLQTGYALARHIGDGPTLIHGLVAIAIASQLNKQIETWVQTPGSPNLYWALTDLPTSFIDLRRPMQGERMWIESFLPHLRQSLSDPTRPPLPLEQLRSAVRQLNGFADGKPGEASGLALLLGAAKYGPAKKFLADRGWTEAQIDALPILQVVFMQEVFEYDRYFDMSARAANLPFPQGHVMMRDADNKLRQMAAGSPLSVPILAKLMLPAVSKVFTARVRLDRHIAALRAIEAIRLYAAASDGKLPSSLDAITMVPVPLDPVTGQPFHYSVSGDKAKLMGPLPPGEALPNLSLQYEITIGK